MLNWSPTQSIDAVHSKCGSLESPAIVSGQEGVTGKVSMFAPNARCMETATNETTFGSIMAAAVYQYFTSNKVMLRLCMLADLVMKRLRTLACAVLLMRVSSLRTFSVAPALRVEII